ncbi:hypothetical protein ACFL55_02870 [Candidatus Latescibacterota bacterium]
MQDPSEKPSNDIGGLILVLIIFAFTVLFPPIGTIVLLAGGILIIIAVFKKSGDI